MYYLTVGKTKVENKWYTSYGIGYEDKIIKDITTDKDRAQQFVDLLNNLKVSPLHIEDTVLDFIE